VIGEIFTRLPYENAVPFSLLFFKMDSGFIKYLNSQLSKLNKPSAREIHASDSGAYLTGPSNPMNHGTQQTIITQQTQQTVVPNKPWCLIL
jgi:hypothetical protein